MPMILNPTCMRMRWCPAIGRHEQIWRLILFIVLAAATPCCGYGEKTWGGALDVRKRMVFVSLSSDDWGRWSNSLPIWSSAADMRSAVRQMGWPHGGVPMPSTAETVSDLQALGRLLRELNRDAPLRQQIVLTPYMVVGGPDYDAMRRTGCPDQPSCEYREMLYPNASGGLNQHPYYRGDLRESYKQLYRERLWRPQYHGRSHFDCKAWVHYLRTGDPLSRFYFDRGMAFYQHGLADLHTGTLHDLNGEYVSKDKSHAKSREEMRRWLQGGLDAFQEWWGYQASVTAVPLHNACSEAHEVLAEAGLGVEIPHEDQTIHQMAKLKSIPRLEIDLDSNLMHGASFTSSIAAQNRERITRALERETYLALQWHASNFQSATLERSHMDLLNFEFAAVVSHVRSTFPNAVFVTSSELLQIRDTGISIETWLDGGVRVRNYNSEARTWTVPMSSGEKGHQMLIVSDCDPSYGSFGKRVKAGERVVMAPMCEYELAREGDTSGDSRAPLREEDKAAARTQPEDLSLEELIYYARVHTSVSEQERIFGLIARGQHDVAKKECADIKRRIESVQQQEHVQICRRCEQCRTCQNSDTHFLSAQGDERSFGEQKIPVVRIRKDLSFFELEEMHDEGAWRERTCVRSDSNFSDAVIAMMIAPAEEGSPSVLSVSTMNYDFKKHGGYVIVADGSQQLAASRSDFFEIILTGPRMVVNVCLIGPDDRPLGVCQSDMWAGNDPTAPVIKSATEKTRISASPWHAGSQISGFPVPIAAPTVRAPEGRRVTFVITACVAMDGRLSLLEETVLSFLRSNTYPIDRYILIDDSGDPRVHQELLDLYGHLFDVLLNEYPRTGQMYSIDVAYSVISSEYVFHCQDDWLFHTKGNFVLESLALLEDKPEVFVVWCRDHRDHDLPLGHEEDSISGVPYRLVLPMQKWKGFTFNPGLRRMSDYEAMRPMQRFWYENNVQGYMRYMGMFGISLTQGWVRHTGDHYSTKPSYQYANENLAKVQMANRGSSSWSV